MLDKIAAATIENSAAKQGGVVGLKFTTEADSKKLNKKYAHHDYPTDVLSFPYQVDQGSTDQSLGDIVICLPIAKTQAKKYEMSLKSELTLLIAHGLLHLLGYDHQSTQDAASLDWMQGAIMKALKQQYRDFQWSH